MSPTSPKGPPAPPDDFNHQLAIKLARALNLVNPNDLLATRVTDIARTSSEDGFLKGQSRPLPLAPRPRPSPLTRPLSFAPPTFLPRSPLAAAMDSRKIVRQVQGLFSRRAVRRDRGARGAGGHWPRPAARAGHHRARQRGPRARARQTGRPHAKRLGACASCPLACPPDSLTPCLTHPQTYARTRTHTHSNTPSASPQSRSSRRPQERPCSASTGSHTRSGSRPHKKAAASGRASTTTPSPSSKVSPHPHPLTHPPPADRPARQSPRSRPRA